MERGWEPEIPEYLQTFGNQSRSASPENLLSDSDNEIDTPSPKNFLSDSEDEDSDEFLNPRHEAESSLTEDPFIESYPNPQAGAPLASGLKSENERYLETLPGGTAENPWAPFKSEMDWAIAKWAKLRGPSSTALTELLSIPKLVEKLELSFSSANELNSIIDKNLPSRPEFKTETIIVHGEAFEVYFRDILECVKALFSEPDFAPYMKYAPEKHFTDGTRKSRMYHDMHTGEWWWSRQVILDKEQPGSTVIPIILSSDKTLVTNFRGKSVYPLYMTIGNIPKEIRKKSSSRAYVLIGYLPTSKLEHISNKTARRRALINMFHSCMQHIVKPLETAGSHGVSMMSGDGATHRGHPILAVYACDYPEQILVTCARYGDCADCEIIEEMMGEGTALYPVRNLAKILHALHTLDTEGPQEFIAACKQARVKPVFDVFWKNLPYSNIFRCITPDILHQLYQGMIKHLKNWVIEAFGEAEIDARCRRLPPNHHVRIFLQGISSLSRITGQEHNDIASFLLSIIIDIPLPGGFSSVRLVRCVRGLVDFLYLAQYPIHTDQTLILLQDALERFHKDKDIFIDLGIREHFQLPKLHFLNHYVQKIKFLGTLDNSNTEHTERLHIDLAKDAYRATNRKDEYFQMIKWLERKEKVLRHDNFLNWLSGGKPSIRHLANWLPSALTLKASLQMAKHPSIRSLSLSSAQKHNSATFLAPSLARYLAKLRFPSESSRQLENRVTNDIDLDIVTHISSFNVIKFVQTDPITNITSTADSIHVQSTRHDKKGRTVPGRFDTALIRIDNNGVNLLKQYRVGQVRLIFTLSEAVMAKLLADVPYSKWPKHLAYIEWFTSFSGKVDRNHQLHKVSRVEFTDGGGLASVVDVSDIVGSVPLTPKFGKVADRRWTSTNVLEKCKVFFVNPYPSLHNRLLYTL
ncbi:hypothetical protein K435DRAFT_680843 [Dendrothele bispora CBS 962.96]|uniref:Uncharacterized protein n=1 Tax=Dendrothele bispora (strain CBS 962.96) TaxID=1314807 RepID=A0A4S8LFZ7_DENBC|nr:hypothetical protein K435DRAFT_680843 [Dendrothele bispora CBS 962.96]